ncbi:unnamed protein product [Ectocarpus sp. 13 AM-2016]
MHRIVSDIRTVRRAYKTDAFRLRVWRTSASRQGEWLGRETSYRADPRGHG